MKQIVCSNCLSRVDASARECPYCGQSFANTNPTGALPVNTLLAGRYTLGKCIAVDGEGVLYGAVDGDTGNRVVVKEYVPFTICSARAADGRVIPRAGREVLFKTTRMDFIDLYRSLTQLGATEGLVRVLDLIEANDTAYAVREPDEGMSLAQYLDELKIPLACDEALDLLEPVVRGVAALHRVGLLHRGISPETIRVTDQGAKLSGYATLGLRTADSELKAELYDGYAAPEQYSVAEFDGRYTDLYSLGAVFYFAVTGRTPLPSNLRRMQDNMPTAHSVLKQVPAYFSTGIACAMRLAPTERTQTAEDLLATLQPSAKRPSAMFEMDKMKILIAAAAVFVLVMALLIWWVLNAVPRKDDSSSSPASLPSTSSETSSAPSTSSESVPLVQQKVVVPTLKGEKYSTVASNSEYQKNFQFMPKHENSSDVPEGYIISQDPIAGTEVDVGTIITLVISDGPNTAVMPAVVNHPLTEVDQRLRTLGIRYTTLMVDNSDPAKNNYVVDCDTAEGTVIDLDKNAESSGAVILYVAKEATGTGGGSSQEPGGDVTIPGGTTVPGGTPAEDAGNIDGGVTDSHWDPDDKDAWKDYLKEAWKDYKESGGDWETWKDWLRRLDGKD